MPFCIYRQTRVVMRIIDSVLVMHYHRTRDAMSLVIVERDHAKQMALALPRRPSIDEKGFIHLLAIYGQRGVLGRVGAQTARILVAVGEDRLGRTFRVRLAIHARTIELT